jgi:hypothetical protein
MSLAELLGGPQGDRRQQRSFPWEKVIGAALKSDSGKRSRKATDVGCGLEVNGKLTTTVMEPFLSEAAKIEHIVLLGN